MFARLLRLTRPFGLLALSVALWAVGLYLAFCTLVFLMLPGTYREDGSLWTPAQESPYVGAASLIFLIFGWLAERKWRARRVGSSS